MIKSKNSFVKYREKKKKILVVDDEKFNCDIFYSFLMLLGCRDRKEMCDFAYSGVDAVEAVKAGIENGEPEKYSVIFMDSSMPFMDGYTATKKIRKLFDSIQAPQPKIVAITGHVEPEYVQKALESGMDNVY